MSQGGLSTVSTTKGVPSDLKSVLTTAVLSRRFSRVPDYAAENRALIALAKDMTVSPQEILQKLVEAALSLCRAQSAGISLLADDQKSFHWPAIAGQWASHVGSGTPRDFGPCGTVLDRNTALIFSHPERDFPYFSEVQPSVEEALLIPFYVSNKAVGTIWVIAHNQGHSFDSEDLRVMTNLATFAAAAYQNLLAMNVTQRIASIVDSCDDAIVSTNLDGEITTWNRGAARLFGYTVEEIVGKPVSILFAPERRDEEFAIFRRIKLGERIEHHNTVRRRNDGVLVPISLASSPVRDVDGKIIGASEIDRDISELKQKEERIELLAREVDHRSKNLLALVLAVVRLANADNTEALKAAIEGRIRALGNLHIMLAETQWAGADMRSLVMGELAPYTLDGQMRVEVIGPDLLLKPRSAQSLAVALHELTTNAVKYGALSVIVGRVRVEWSLATDGRLVIVWTECLGPRVSAPLHQGFGTRVVRQIINGELNGTSRFDWHPLGFVCELGFDPAIVL